MPDFPIIKAQCMNWWQVLKLKIGRWLVKDYPTITFPAAGIDPARIRVIERHYRVQHDSRITMPETYAAMEERELKNVMFGMITTLIKDGLIIAEKQHSPSDLGVNVKVRLLVIDPNHHE